MGFRVLVSLHPAIQATGRLTLAPAGLPPAEHTSLHWAHNRTDSVPASGFPTGVIIKHTAATSDARDSAAAHPVPRRHVRERTGSRRALASYVVCAENRALGHRHVDQQPDTPVRESHG